MGSSPIFRIKDKVKDTYVSFILIFAEVAELADAQASGACSSNTVRVQVPSSALIVSIKQPGDICLPAVFMF